jgi:HPt (histidine-containing phosphotransfer) domain-containing protein
MTKAIIDRDALIERLGGDVELATEMAVVLMTDLPEALERIRASVSSGTADDLREAAHSLKGALLNFLPDGPTQTAAALEYAGRNGRMADTPALLAELEQQMPQLIASLQASLGIR